MNEDDELVFEEEDEISTESQKVSGTSDLDEPWKVLIVDDEPDVHHVTSFALNGFSYLGRPIEFYNAYSAAEAVDLIANQKIRFALILLDVVMEDKNSGLNIVKFIRGNLNDYLTQIILRTGQPGEAPEELVIQKYHINAYRLKTELTREGLFAIVTLSLRTFRDLSRLELSKQKLEFLNGNLEKIVEDRTEELELKNEKLKESLHENRNLIRVLSHDLNNYLSITLHSATLGIQNVENKEKSLTHLARIEKACRSQHQLITHVLELAASQDNKKPLHLEDVKLVEIFRMMTFAFEDKLAEKEIKLSIEYRSSEEQTIHVDPVPFLNSVINNTISNAIKFTPQRGEINIIVDEDIVSNMTAITVEDSGIGIPSDILKNLFSLSEKTSRIGTNGEAGTGFGMPLLKSYLEKMNGRVEIESKTADENTKDHGTRVTIFIPSKK